MTNLPHWKKPWHLDRQVPLALIGAILIQTGAAFWWASSINERVDDLDAWKLDSKALVADIAVVKSQVTDMRTILDRIVEQVSRQSK